MTSSVAAMTVLTAFTAFGEEAVRVSCFTSDITSLSSDYDAGAIKFHVKGKDFIYFIPTDSNNKELALNLRITEFLRAKQLEFKYTTNTAKEPQLDDGSKCVISSELRYIYK